MDLSKMNTEGRELQDMHACIFDFNAGDSEFDLKEEVAGVCSADKLNKTKVPEKPKEIQPSGSSSALKTLPDKTDADLGKRENEKPGILEDIKTNSNLDDKYYRGLPKSLKEKHYSADYPTDLHLHKICSPKPKGKRKTVDNFKTQPVANFTPVSSKDALAKQKNKKADGSGESKAAAATKECQLSTRELPPIVSVSDEIVIDYLEENNIQMMLEYFLGMCVLNTPADPFQYITDLADQLINARTDESAFEKVPRLLEPAHVESMFRLYDRVGSGFLSHMQYKNAMESMGLVKFSLDPEGCTIDEISKDTFVSEANTAINDLLRSFMSKQPRSDC